MQIQEKDSDYFDYRLHFNKESNQLFDFKPFLNNSHLPTSIAAELEKFCTRHTRKIGQNEIVGAGLIVINSNYYEPIIWDKGIVPGFILWETNSFAFTNWENFIV